MKASVSAITRLLVGPERSWRDSIARVSSVAGALPLVYYTSDEHGYKSISAVSSGRRDDGSGFFNVLGLLFHRGWKSKENETYTHVCWPLYARGQSVTTSRLTHPGFHLPVTTSRLPPPG